MINQEEIDKAAEEYVRKEYGSGVSFTKEDKENAIYDFEAGVEWVLQYLKEKSNAKINRVDLETAKRFRDVAFSSMQRHKSELDAIIKAYLKAKEEYHFYDGVVTVMQEQYENKV